MATKKFKFGVSSQMMGIPAMMVSVDEIGGIIVDQPKTFCLSSSWHHAVSMDR